MINAQDKSKRPTSASSSSMSIITPPFTGRSSLSRFDFILGIMRGSITSCMAGSVGGSSMSFVKSSSSSWIGKRRLPDGVGAGVRMLFKKHQNKVVILLCWNPLFQFTKKTSAKFITELHLWDTNKDREISVTSSSSCQQMQEVTAIYDA